MSIDISNENLLSLPAAAQTLPSRPHVSTLHRWRLRGVRGVKLETCLIGGRRYTSREAVERFSTAATAAANHNPLPVCTPHQRQRDITRAEREVGIADGQEASERAETTT